jgi:pilus assembly protein CpaB
MGMRAISIEINEFSGVGNMLLPGCMVDVLATVPAEQGGEMLSRTVVQNVKIMAVGQRMVSQPKKEGDEPVVFRSVTLQVTPAEAEAVELAASSGRPRLVLRSGTDTQLTATPGVTTSNLRGSSQARKLDPTFNTVKVIRGTVESEVRMDTGWFDGGTKTAGTDTKAVTNTDTAPATGD